MISTADAGARGARAGERYKYRGAGRLGHARGGARYAYAR